MKLTLLQFCSVNPTLVGKYLQKYIFISSWGLEQCCNYQRYIQKVEIIQEELQLIQLYILKGLFRHIYIEKGQMKCFNFSFLGWGLRVSYNSDIFETPPSVFKCPNLNFRHFCFIFSRFLIMTPPLSFYVVKICRTSWG